MAQCLAFAAAYGYKNNAREKISKAPTSKVDPIAYHIFENNHFDRLFVMLAMVSVEDPKNILGDQEAPSNKRVTIFEEYAKGGLKLLKSKISGVVDYLDPILEITLVSEEIKKHPSGFDITDLKHK